MPDAAKKRGRPPKAKELSAAPDEVPEDVEELASVVATMPGPSVADLEAQAAEAEKKVEEARAAELAANPWTMPHIEIGDRVLFYPSANKKSDSPHPGIVIKLGQWALVIQTSGSSGTYGIPRASVRHIEDPFLVGRPDYGNQNGAWDHSSEFKRFDAIEKRLAALEG